MSFDPFQESRDRFDAEVQRTRPPDTVGEIPAASTYNDPDRHELVVDPLDEHSRAYLPRSQHAGWLRDRRKAHEAERGEA
jgi:hypothetical protein